MNTHIDDQILSQEEQDILQEVMNIAFGQASADLAEVIDIFVNLNVPSVETIRTSELPAYICREIQDYGRISIVEQNYLGRFQGIALLVFPAGAGKEIFAILSPGQQGTGSAINLALLEKEALQEIGNILIGACVGKIVELLDDIVTYSPPRVVLESNAPDSVPPGIFAPGGSAIIMQTVFSFQERDISGYLFLINNPQSINWLRKALLQFLENLA
jgi:chemotaxis protein CheC